MHTVIPVITSSSVAHGAEDGHVLSGDLLVKEIRKARDAKRYYEDFIAQARAMDEASAAARVAFDLLDAERLAEFGTPGGKCAVRYLHADMAQRAAANPFYDQALQAAAPTLYPTIKAGLPDMAWMYAPSNLANLPSREFDPAQDARSIPLK